MPKSVGGAEGCLLGDGVKPESKARTTLVAELRFQCGFGSLTSAGLLCTLCPLIRMLLTVFLVLNLVIFFKAVAADLGWWPSESDSSV